MKLFYVNNDRTRLLIFFCGFFVNPDSFADFDNGAADILYIYDYSDLNFEELLYFDYLPYTEINLISYSYGVFASNIAARYLPPLNSLTAVSGTIFPIDENYGIRPKIFDLMLGAFNLDVLNNFKIKMNSPFEIKGGNYDIERLLAELTCIKNYVLENKINLELKFDKAIVTKKDKIFPYSAQINFWKNKTRTIELDCGHFPFYNFKNFDGIIEL